MKNIAIFNNRTNDADRSSFQELGIKGANLCEMNKMGIPVPAGFVISRNVCNDYFRDQKLSPAVMEEIKKGVASIEEATGLKYGDLKNPLLLSIRSGASVSMPGMLETILNCGINDKNFEGLVSSYNENFAYDTYRRFIHCYGTSVLGVNRSFFDLFMEDHREAKGYTIDQFKPSDWKVLIDKFKNKIVEQSSQRIPQDPYQQLFNGISAIFNSWNNPRAKAYRKINDIPEDLGMAITIQAMVFGNLDDKSCTGVVFSRNPKTGEKTMFGEYLLRSQGEDIVNGSRTPLFIANNETGLEKKFPNIYGELLKYTQKLEAHYKDVQDIEFTVQSNKLFILQTRNAKRSPEAALKIAVALHEENLVSKQEALAMIQPKQVEQFLLPRIDPSSQKILFAKGLGASSGSASGQIVFDSEKAIQWAKQGRDVILCRLETSTEDIEAIHESKGVIALKGGMTSHAAVIARGMGVPCVTGCNTLQFDSNEKTLNSGTTKLHEGDFITLDGNLGELYQGELNLIISQEDPSFEKIIKWSNEIKKLKVYSYADSLKEVEMAFNLGAEGIGVYRTENMFIRGERLEQFRAFILSEDENSRESFATELLQSLTDDFISIFNIVKERPFTVRLLDTSLKDFLPDNDQEIIDISMLLDLPYDRVKRKIDNLLEVNPLFGHRSCRLGVSFPDLYALQVKAIARAVLQYKTRTKLSVQPSILIPFVMESKEIKFIKDYLQRVIQQENPDFRPSYGVILEVPRALVMSDEITPHVDFCVYGTNDLTQNCFSMSRIDSGAYLNHYMTHDIFAHNPFDVIDEKGVGWLIKSSMDLGKRGNPQIKYYVCGDHGSNPYSIHCFNKWNLDGITCEHPKVPVSILSAARAVIK